MQSERKQQKAIRDKTNGYVVKMDGIPILSGDTASHIKAERNATRAGKSSDLVYQTCTKK